MKSSILLRVPGEQAIEGQTEGMENFKSNRSGSARVLDPGDLQRLIGELDFPHRLVAQLCYYTAARIEEVTLLHWDDVDRAGRALLYRSANTKTDTTRYAVMPDELMAVIAAAIAAGDLPTEGYLFPARRRSGKERVIRRKDKAPVVKPVRATLAPRSVDHAIRKACVILNLKGVSTHSFRRSMATHLARIDGMTLADVAAVTGHKDLSSLSHYIDADQSRAIAALKTVSARLRSPG